ncbi:hypothetical protein [Persicobacter psychrovividus]|uniref:hypothetical protein n=1 Tax=Persicobacter psychrovividus TaxID=387638 RepID=UPI0030CA1D18
MKWGLSSKEWQVLKNLHGQHFEARIAKLETYINATNGQTTALAQMMRHVPSNQFDDLFRRIDDLTPDVQSTFFGDYAENVDLVKGLGKRPGLVDQIVNDQIYLDRFRIISQSGIDAQKWDDPIFAITDINKHDMTLLSSKMGGELPMNASIFEELVMTNYLASRRPFLEKTAFGVSEEGFKILISKLHQYSRKIGLPKEGELLTKIQPGAWYSRFIDKNGKFIKEVNAGDYNSVAGFVGRGEYFEPKSIRQIMEEFRLDYNGKPYDITDDFYVVIKFKNDDPSKLRFTYDVEGNMHPKHSPMCNTGFAGSKSSLKPEYEFKEGMSRIYKEGDILEFRSGTDGQLMVKYKFIKEDKSWKIIE